MVSLKTDLATVYEACRTVIGRLEKTADDPAVLAAQRDAVLEVFGCAETLAMRKTVGTMNNKEQ